MDVDNFISMQWKHVQCPSCIVVVIVAVVWCAVSTHQTIALRHFDVHAVCARASVCLCGVPIPSFDIQIEADDEALKM